MSEYVFVNISSNHFKIWGYDAFHREDTGEGEFIAYYGKIGLPMHKLRKHRKCFKSWGDCYDYTRAKIEEKLLKGYKRMKNWEYFGHLHEEKPLSELISKIESLPRLYR